VELNAEEKELNMRRYDECVCDVCGSFFTTCHQVPKLHFDCQVDLGNIEKVVLKAV